MMCSFFSTCCVPLFTDCVPFKIVTNKYKKKSFRGLLKLQSSGDVEGSVKLMQTALELDEKCEFAYETLGTIGKIGFVEISVLKLKNKLKTVYVYLNAFFKVELTKNTVNLSCHNFLFFVTEVQRGNLKRAIELFDKAIPLANTELEMAHLFGLRDAALAQITVSTKFGIVLPAMGV